MVFLRVSFAVALIVLLGLLSAAKSGAVYTPSYVKVPDVPVKLYFASRQLIEESYDSSTADIVERIQLANAYWLPVHAKSRVYTISYTWSSYTQSGDNINETYSEVPAAGRYDRPFMSTPLSEFVIYGGVLGSPTYFSVGRASNPETQWVSGNYKMKGRIMGKEAALIAPFIRWPAKCTGLVTPEDYRDILLNRIEDAKIEYEIIIDAETYLVDSERFVVWSEGFIVPGSNEFGEYQVRYNYEYEEGNAQYPNRVTAEAVALPIVNRGYIRDDDFSEMRRIYKFEGQAYTEFKIDAKLVDGVWIPYAMTEESRSIGIKIIYEADSIGIRLLKPSAKLGRKWLYIANPD